MLQEILTVGFFTAFLSAAVRLAMPLMYGGLGEMIAERAGILNIGMEGVMPLPAPGIFTASLWACCAVC